MIVLESVEQGSEQWLNMRKGKPTASEAKKIMTPKGALSKSRLAYMRKLCAECVIDDPMEFMGTKYTDWGQENEPLARAAFTDETGLSVSEVAFCTREDGVIGFSPDGLIKGDDGEWIAGLEIKCPSRDKHVEYLLDGVLPDDHKLQVHWSLAASGLDTWHFVSFFPGLQTFMIEVPRDSFTETVSQAQDDFLIEYAATRPAMIAAIELPMEFEALNQAEGMQ